MSLRLRVLIGVVLAAFAACHAAAAYMLEAGSARSNVETISPQRD